MAKSGRTSCTICLLWLLILTVNASLVLFDEILKIPDGWTLSELTLRDQPMWLKIHYRMSNVELLEEKILSAAAPEHADYGKHLTRDELFGIVGPAAEVAVSTERWLRNAEVSDIHTDSNHVAFRCTISQAKTLLNATFRNFEDVQGNSIVRTLSYSLPEHLHAYIDTIQPTTRFPRVRPRVNTKSMDRTIVERQSLNTSDCHQFVNPRCLRRLYKIGDVPIRNDVNNTLAVNSFAHDYAQYDDLAQFQKDFAPWTIGRNFTWTSINGGKMTQNGVGSEEANLDVQYAMAIGFPARIHVYSTGGHGPTIPDQIIPADSNEPWLDFLDYVVKLPNEELPQTMSTSYAEDEQTLPRGYARAVCNKFACLAARGVSVIVGSGDWGPGQGCESNDGKKTRRFQPQFPSVCTWVTSVGGTQGFEHEVADSLSSGGFSNYFKRPSWQDAAVQNYIEGLNGRWDGLYNKSGRGFPDVAAQSESYVVIGDGEEDADSGTSAAAPTFAGIVALLNGARLSAGKPPLGFLNPWIYKKAHKALNDIVDGKSVGCESFSTPYIPDAGWNASKGWDAVTGWGTPNFEGLLNLALGDKTGDGQTSAR